MIKFNLKQLCADKGINTVEEIHTITGISKSIIEKMFNNENTGRLNLRHIEDVCNKLDICPYDMIEGFRESKNSRIRDI